MTVLADLGSGASFQVFLTVMLVVVAVGFGFYGYNKYKKG